MKKAIAILCFVCMISMSCEKLTTSCYDCTITTVSSVSPNLDGYPQTIKTDITICDVTPAEAKEYEKEQSATSTTTSGGYDITVTVTARCIRQ